MVRMVIFISSLIYLVNMLSAELHSITAESRGHREQCRQEGGSRVAGPAGSLD